MTIVKLDDHRPLRVVKIFAVLEGGGESGTMPPLFPNRAAAEAHVDAKMKEFWEDYDEHYLCPWVDWDAHDHNSPSKEDIALLERWEALVKSQYGDPIPEFPPYPGVAGVIDRFPDMEDAWVIHEIDFQPEIQV